MNDEQFEKILKAQPPRQIPSAWRAGILQQATATDRAPGPAAGGRTLAWWHARLWPNPAAWGGLAAAWLIILGLGWLTDAPAGSGSSQDARSVSVADLQAALAFWHRAEIELTESDEPAKAKPLRTTPALRPQSRDLAPLPIRLT
jgi:hypothetical protein